MKRLALIALILAALAPLGFAWQTDTNATTTITLYTPEKPTDLLIGAKGSTATVWVAVGQTTNDWKQITNN